MKAKTLLALGIISGIEPAYDKWFDFFGCDAKPERNPHKESLFEYRDRVELIIKKAAVDYLGELLGNIVKEKN